MQFRYFRPNSLTWWAGAFAVTVGVAQLSGVGMWAHEIGQVVSRLAGGPDASPAASITLGLGLIGVRDKLARVFGGGDASDDQQN